MKWQTTPVFLPGESHGQRSLVGYGPWDQKRVRHDWGTKQQTAMTNRHKTTKAYFWTLYNYFKIIGFLSSPIYFMSCLGAFLVVALVAGATGIFLGGGQGCAQPPTTHRTASTQRKVQPRMWLGPQLRNLSPEALAILVSLSYLLFFFFFKSLLNLSQYCFYCLSSGFLAPRHMES